MEKVNDRITYSYIHIDPVIKRTAVQEAFIRSHFCQPYTFDFKNEIFLNIGALNDKCYKLLLRLSENRIKGVQFSIKGF